MLLYWFMLIYIDLMGFNLTHMISENMWAVSELEKIGFVVSGTHFSQRHDFDIFGQPRAGVHISPNYFTKHFVYGFIEIYMPLYIYFP
jgi:hypothetical protein